MLVKNKNLNNNRVTEEKDIFVSQLLDRLPDIGENFVGIKG